jgi:hypothetical protein
MRSLIVRRRDRAISLPTRRHGGAVIGLMGLLCAGKSFFMETALALGVPCLYVGALIRMKFGDDAFDLSPVDEIELPGKSASVFRALGPELREAYGPNEIRYGTPRAASCARPSGQFGTSRRRGSAHCRIAVPSRRHLSVSSRSPD